MDIRIEHHVTDPVARGAGGQETHTHKAHEVIYVQEGSVLVTVENRRYTVYGGTLVFISHLENHLLEPQAGRYVRYFAILPPEMVRQITADDRLAALFTGRPEGFVHCLDMSGYRRELDDIFARLHGEAAGELPYAHRRVCALLEELLITVYRARPEVFPAPVGRAENTVLQVKAYIEEHYAEDITIATLAAAFYISPCHLSHVFKRSTGYTIKQYLLLNRLAEARALLYGTNLTVGELSARAGFADVNNFIRYFKQQMGMTPKQYRLQLTDNR